MHAAPAARFLQMRNHLVFFLKKHTIPRDLGSCCGLGLGVTSCDEAPRARRPLNMSFKRAPNRAGNFSPKKGGELARW